MSGNSPERLRERALKQGLGGKTSTSFKPGQKATENLQPDKVADLVVSMAENPGESIKALARACGMSDTTANSIVKRLNMKYQPVMEEVKKLTSKQLADKMESKLPMLIDAIDGKVPDATLRDVAVMIGVLTEKRQLLNGEPTHIMTYEERENVDELVPALLKEMDRRNMVVDVTFKEIPDVQVHNPDQLPVEALSKTAQGMAKREARAKNR